MADVKRAIMDGPYQVRDIPGNEMEDTGLEFSTPIIDALTDLDKALVHLDEVIEVLNVRTNPIRYVPSNDMVNKAVGDPTQPHSLIVSNIEDKTVRLRGLTNQIKVIVEQLEV